MKALIVVYVLVMGPPALLLLTAFVLELVQERRLARWRCPHGLGVVNGGLLCPQCERDRRGQR